MLLMRRGMLAISGDLGKQSQRWLLGGWFDPVAAMSRRRCCSALTLRDIGAPRFSHAPFGERSAWISFSSGTHRSRASVAQVRGHRIPGPTLGHGAYMRSISSSTRSISALVTSRPVKWSESSRRGSSRGGWSGRSAGGGRGGGGRGGGAGSGSGRASVTKRSDSTGSARAAPTGRRGRRGRDSSSVVRIRSPKPLRQASARRSAWRSDSFSGAVRLPSSTSARRARLRRRERLWRSAAG